MNNARYKECRFQNLPVGARLEGGGYVLATRRESGEDRVYVAMPWPAGVKVLKPSPKHVFRYEGPAPAPDLGPEGFRYATGSMYAHTEGRVK